MWWILHRSLVQNRPPVLKQLKVERKQRNRRTQRHWKGQLVTQLSSTVWKKSLGGDHVFESFTYNNLIAKPNRVFQLLWHSKKSALKFVSPFKQRYNVVLHRNSISWLFVIFDYISTYLLDTLCRGMVFCLIFLQIQIHYWEFFPLDLHPLSDLFTLLCFDLIMLLYPR